MVYVYIRVSSDKQTVENLRFVINKFCGKQNLVINDWIEETISGTKNYTKRQLGNLLKKVHKDDIIICSELSMRVLFVRLLYKQPPSRVSTGDQTFMQHCERIPYIICLLAVWGHLSKCVHDLFVMRTLHGHKVKNNSKRGHLHY